MKTKELGDDRSEKFCSPSQVLLHFIPYSTSQLFARMEISKLFGNSRWLLPFWTQKRDNITTGWFW